MGTLNDPNSQVNIESDIELTLEQNVAENEKQTTIVSAQNLLNITTNTNLSNTTTTNSCSSTNSLHLTEEEEEAEESEDYENFNDYERNHHKTNTNQSQLIVSNIDLENPASISLIRNNQTTSSSSSSSTTSSNSSTTSAHIVISKCGSNHEIAQTQLSNENLQHHTNKYIFILNGFVNGFAQLKLSADKTDYEYIIEVYWSNDTKSFIKRTYDDFVRFHATLLQTFSQFFNELANKKNICKNSNILSNSICNLTTISASKNNNGTRSSFCLNGHMMPILPAKKKPFWISHLKLAESREIELNTYVQAILNLPIKISHSPMVLQFFESQPSDPKPSRIGRVRNYDNNLESSELGSDSNEEYREYDLDDCDDADTHDNHNSNPNISNININSINSNKHNKNDYLSKVELDEDDEEEDQDDDDEDDEYDDYNNYYDRNTSSKRIKQINSNNFGVNGLTRSKKRVNKEAGLWWDEDMALNELTSSMSFDFDSQYHLQSPIGGNGGVSVAQNNKNNFFARKLQEHDEVVTLKTLQSIHSNNESNKSSKENIISSSSTSIISAGKTGENLIRRLSLS